MFNSAKTKYLESRIKKLEQECEAERNKNGELLIENQSLKKMAVELDSQLKVYKENFDTLAKQLNDSIASANEVRLQYEAKLRVLEQLKSDYKDKVEKLISDIIKN